MDNPPMNEWNFLGAVGVIIIACAAFAVLDFLAWWWGE